MNQCGTKSKLLFRLTLTGQVPPGKSNQGKRQDGSTYPKAKRFAPWVAWQKAQHRYPPEPHVGRFLLQARYTPGDLRPRNVAGMQDAIMHYLENGGRMPKNKLLREAWKKRRRWIGDDEMIVDVDWKMLALDRDHPLCRIEIWSR